MRLARVLGSARKLALAVIVAGCLSPGAEAQQFGQWWWVASATASGREISARSRDGGESASASNRLRFRFGLRGFIVHPAIGEFRLDLDGSASKFSGARGVETNQIGFDTQLELLRYGYFPISLYARRGFFDYNETADGSSFSLSSLPDTQQVWGGLISSRWKALRGLRFRFLSSEVEFLDPDLGREVTEEQELLWSRHVGGISHHARLSRRYLEFPIGDFAAEDLLLSFEQSGKISPRWHWRQTLGGTRRDLPGRPGDTATETLALSSQLRRRYESGNHLRLLISASSASSPATRVEGAALSGEYSLLQSARWTLSPTAGYSLTRLDDEILAAAQAGVSASWNWRRGPRSLSVFNGLGYVATSSDRPGPGSPESDALTYELRVAAGDNPPDRLGRQLEVILSHNEIAAIEQIDPESIDFGLVVNRDLLVDSLTGRLTLSRVWGRLQASSNTFWTRRESSSTARSGTVAELPLPCPSRGPSSAEDPDRPPPRPGTRRPGGDPCPGPRPPTADERVEPAQRFESDTLSQVFQISRDPFDFSASLASSWVASRGADEQRADLITSALRWRPYQPLSLSLRYRSEERDTALAPTRDFERFELAVDFTLGRLSMEASYFETVNNSGAVRGRSNRGFRWRVTRRAAGLLPIISAPKRRGVIR